MSWRVAIAVAVIGPLEVLLGMPFPTGLRIVAEEAPTLVPWAWGVNGFSTVIGSVGAMILAMVFGFRIVLAVAGACYLASLAAIMMPRAGELLRRGKLRESSVQVKTRSGDPCLSDRTRLSSADDERAYTLQCRTILTAEQFGSLRGPRGPYTVSPAQLSHPSRPLDSLHRGRELHQLFQSGARQAVPLDIHRPSAAGQTSGVKRGKSPKAGIPFGP